MPDEMALAALRVPQPSSDALEKGTGAGFKVMDQREPGKRDLEFDAGRGLIVNEALTSQPVSLVVESWGGRSNKRVALTFDDGPDRTYTPLILDILKEKNVPAAFFVIGRNALQNPTAMQRIYEDGHEIGNHTFSHPNLSTRPIAEVQFELNTT